MEIEKLERVCPKCGGIITYKRKGDKTTATRKNSNCKKCSSEDRKFKKGIGCSVIPECSIPKYNLDFLLDGSLQSMYFLGLIVSDGSFYKTRFEITLKEEDIHILELLSNLCGSAPVKDKKVKSTIYKRVSFNNKESIEYIMEYFDIRYQKTYNPIEKLDLYKYDFNQMIAFIIGCIDGDGCCYADGNGKNPSIKLTHHSNWNTFYTNVLDYIGLPFSRRLKKDTDVSTTSLSRTKTIILLRDFIIENNLSVLHRKWDKFKNVKINEKISNSYRN